MNKKYLTKRITALAVILTMSLPVGAANAQSKIKATYDEYRAAEFEWIQEAEGEPCFELIDEIGFEEKDKALLLSPETMSYSEEVFHSGNVSMHLVGSEDESISTAYDSTIWRLEKHAKYNLSVWVKAENLEDNEYVTVEAWNLDEEIVKITQPTEDWQKLEFNNVSIGELEHTGILKVRFSPEMTGDFYIDDITLIKVANPPQRVHKLKNPEFLDVEKEHWAYDSIANLYNNGIVSGKSDSEFKPSDKITREEFAKIAVMASIDKKSKNTDTFSDVANGSWYEAYVETAAESGLVNGMAEGFFGTGQYVTRQDAAVILDRIMANKGIAPDGSAVSFNDGYLVADYAKQAVNNLSAAGFIGGDENGNFNPTNPITRAEVCAIIDRMEIIENRHPDMLYRIMPEEEDIGEIIAEATFDTMDSVKDYPALSSKYTTEEGNKKKGCIVLNDGDYENFDLILSKGMKNQGNARLYFEININSQLNDTAKVTVKSSLIKADGTLVKSGGNTSFTGSSNGWRKMSFNFSNNAAFDAIKLSFEFEGATYGDVYFDDITVKTPTHPLEAGLVIPNYKGLIFDEYGKNKGENDIILRTWVLQNFMKESIEDVALKAQILDKENFVVLSSEHDNVSERMRVTFSSKYLDYGDYILKTSLENKDNGREIDAVYTILRKREGSITELASYVDEEGIYVADGKRELFFGAYTNGWFDYSFFDDLDGTAIDKMVHYSSGYDGFYTPEYWEVLNKTGLELAPTLRLYINRTDIHVGSIAEERIKIESRVNYHKNNPKAWGYNLHDEPPTYEFRDRVAWHNEIASSLDLERITFMADNKFTELNGFTKNFSVNAMGEDIYTITKNENDTTIGRQTDVVRALRKGFLNKPIWHILQSTNTTRWYGDNDPTWQAPSEQQQKNMVMQSLCEGATGAVWYSWAEMAKNVNGDMYEDLVQRTVNASNLFKGYEDIILSYEDAPAVTTTGGSWLNHMAKRYQGKTYLFVGNRTINPEEASFTIEGATSAVSKLTGEVYSVDSSGTFTVPLDNIEIDIIEIEQPDYLSPVAQIKNVSLYSGEKSFIMEETANGFVANVGKDAGEIFYSVSYNDGATLEINNTPSPNQGKALSDNLTISVISADKKHTDTVNVTINRD